MNSKTLIVSYITRDIKSITDFVNLSLFKDEYIKFIISDIISRYGYTDLLGNILYSMQSVNYENLTTKDYMLLFTIRNEIKSEYIDFICYNEIFNYLENIINQFSIIRKKHLEATLCIDSIMLNKNNLLITTDLLIT